MTALPKEFSFFYFDGNLEVSVQPFIFPINGKPYLEFDICINGDDEYQMKWHNEVDCETKWEKCSVELLRNLVANGQVTDEWRMR
jgi:hypothetical protein